MSDTTYGLKGIDKIIGINKTPDAPNGAPGVYLFEIFPQRLQDELVSAALLCIYPCCHLFGQLARDVDRSLHILCVLTAGAKDGVALLLAKVLKHPLLCGAAEATGKYAKTAPPAGRWRKRWRKWFLF